MSEFVPGSYSLAIGGIQEKKKRGRPCKAEGSRKRGKKPAASVNETEAIGQPVTGVIDGAFGAGFLVSVRVGASNKLLRGAVFTPGRFAPVNLHNDVAPGIVTYKRKRSRRAKVNSRPSDADPPQSEKAGVEDQPVQITTVLPSEIAEEQDKVLPEIPEPSFELAVDFFAGVDPDVPSGVVHDPVPLRAISADDVLLNVPELMEWDPKFELVNDPMEKKDGEGNSDVISALSFSAVKDVASEMVPEVACGVVTVEPKLASGE